MRGWNKGTTRLTPKQYLALVVRILGNLHGRDVIERMDAYLGERAARMGPADLTRNVLMSWCARVCRAYVRPPMASGITDALVAVLGDHSATTLVERYAVADGRPLPTAVAQASGKAQRYQETGGYAGVLISWSERTARITLSVITPDDLQADYASEDPSEPTVVRYSTCYTVDGDAVEAVDVYDLTDLRAPSYRVMAGDDDITQAVHDQTYEGADYIWRAAADKRYPEGRPFHRIVVRGHPDDTYRRLQQVEASLVVPIRWTAWGSGTDLASHPGRNVMGMKLVGMASDTATGATGMADGPEVIKRWVPTTDELTPEHWQDAPAFEPLSTAKAVALYESLTLSAIDLPMLMDGTGGEPTKREQEAQEEAILATLTECRRFDAELLRRCAATANRIPEVAGSTIPEGPFGLLYRGEVDAALLAVETRAGERDGGRTDRRGRTERESGDASGEEAGPE
jgi:hypothetical protein